MTTTDSNTAPEDKKPRRRSTGEILDDDTLTMEEKANEMLDKPNITPEIEAVLGRKKDLKFFYQEAPDDKKDIAIFFSGWARISNGNVYADMIGYDKYTRLKHVQESIKAHILQHDSTYDLIANAYIRNPFVNMAGEVFYPAPKGNSISVEDHFAKMNEKITIFDTAKELEEFIIDKLIEGKQ